MGYCEGEERQAEGMKMEGKEIGLVWEGRYVEEVSSGFFFSWSGKVVLARY